MLRAAGRSACECARWAGHAGRPQTHRRRPEVPSRTALATGDYLHKPVHEIKGSGYCVESLEAALWCFATTPSFESAVLAAANLGDDADTTAAITGQIAGAYYGVQAIPPHWLDRLFMARELNAMACDLMRRH